MFAIYIKRNFENLGNSPDLEFKEMEGNPVKLAKVLEAGNSMRAISQIGKNSEETTVSDKADPIPIFLNGLIPRQFGSLRSYKQA